jgi:hypothetical protein
MYIYWAHIVTTGEIVTGSSIDAVLAQLDSTFYGPIYRRWNWPTSYTITAINFNSTQVFEVL